PQQVSSPFLTGPLWPSPQSYRRLLARDEGCHRGRTMFSRSPSALPAHTPGAYGTSRATHLCVSLVVDSASYFAGAAVGGMDIFWGRQAWWCHAVYCARFLSVLHQGMIDFLVCLSSNISASVYVDLRLACHESALYSSSYKHNQRCAHRGLPSPGASNQWC